MKLYNWNEVEGIELVEGEGLEGVAVDDNFFIGKDKSNPDKAYEIRRKWDSDSQSYVSTDKYYTIH